MNLPTIGHYFSLVVGFFALFIGIAAATRPKEMSKNFGIPVSGEALPYVVSTGIRDVFIGLIVLILFYFQTWTVLGVSYLCISIVAISDFLVVRKYGDKKVSLIHLGGAIVSVLYGAWLIFNTFE